MLFTTVASRCADGAHAAFRNAEMFGSDFGMKKLPFFLRADAEMLHAVRTCSV